MAVLNNTGVLAGSSIATGDDFKLKYSCHFDSEQNMARSYTSTSDFNNDFTWTVSWWIKPHYEGSEVKMWGGNDYHRGRSFMCGFTGEGKLAFECSWGNWYSKRLIKDNSAWYHIVAAYDSTQATQGNRFKVFVNGEEWEASSQDYPAQNYASGFNGPRSRQWIGCSVANHTNQTTSKFLRGQIAHFNIVQSLQLHAKSFGESNAKGRWVPIKFVDNYSALTGSKTGTHEDWKASRLATDLSWQGTSSTSSVTQTYTSNYWQSGLLFDTNWTEITTQDLAISSNMSVTHNGASGYLVSIKDGNDNIYQVDDGGNGELLTVFNGNSQSGTPFTGTMAGPIYIKQVSGGSYLYSVWVDGQHLINGYDYKNRDGHLCDIRFNDITSNSNFWSDYRDIGKIENATGALPIRETTDDFGLVVDGSNFRTDSLASNLTVAIPMNGNVTDYSATIKGSGTAASITANGGFVQDSWDNYFYTGSGRFHDGSFLEWTNVKPIADNSSTWCIETWMMVDNSHTGSQQIYDSSLRTDDSSGIYFYCSGQAIYAWATGTQIAGQSEGDISRDRWQHVAFTMNSGHGRLFVDGRLVAENSSWNNGGAINGNSVNLIGCCRNSSGSNSQHFIGQMQDFRIYDGTAKYTSNFQPPLRTVWHPENINTKIQDDSQQPSQGIVQHLQWTGDGNTNRQLTTNSHPGFVWIHQTNGTGDPFHWSVNGPSSGQGSWVIDSNGDLKTGRIDTGQALSDDKSKRFNATNLELRDTANQNVNGNPYQASVFYGASDGSFISDTSQDIDCMRSTNASKTISIVHFKGDGAANSEVAHGLGVTPCLVLLYGHDNYFRAYTRNGPSNYNYWKADGLTSNKGTWNVHNYNNHYALDANRFGSDNMGNNNDGIAICFGPQAGLLASGTYTGNDQSSGPTLSAGFKSGTLLIKRQQDDGAGWFYTTFGPEPPNMNSNFEAGDYKWLNDTYGTRTDGGGKVYATASGDIQISTSGNWAAGGLNTNNKKYFWMAIASDLTLATTDKHFDFSKDSPLEFINPADSQDVSGPFAQPMFPTDHSLDDHKNSTGLKELNNIHLQGVHSSNGWKCSHGSMPVKSGKWYFEVEVGASTATAAAIGVVKIDDYGADQKGFTSARSYDSGGGKVSGGTNTAYGSGYLTIGNVIGCGFDLDNGTIDFWLNGTHQGQAFTDLTVGDTYLPFLQGYHYGAFYLNFGVRPFKYSNYGTNRAAATYLPMCSAHIADPTVTDPSKLFNAVKYTGTASEKAINDFAFQPDLLFLKKTSGTGDWQAYDAERGVTKAIHLNTDEPQTTIAQGVKSFDSDGFTLGTDTEANTSGADYIAYGWDAGTAQAASGTWGSNNKAYTRWTSTTSGLSIIDWVGDGSSTVGIPHGLGKKPKVMIWRQYVASSQVWYVTFDCKDGTNDYASFTQNAHANQSDAFFDATNVTNFGAQDGNNVLGYVFAEVDGFSKIGTFTGSGTANDDGPFVFTGFQPAMILYKNIDTGSTDWVVYDDQRGFNQNSTADAELDINNNTAEVGGNTVNFHTNGFQIRNASDNTRNKSGDKYLYLAFARKPFKFSNGGS